MKQSYKLNNKLENFELLRIFAMFLIVLHHCIAHGVFSYWNDNSSISQVIRNLISFLLNSGGEVGVTLFVLLTGYFSCQQNFRLKKCLDIYLKTWFFSVLIYLGYFFIKPNSLITLSVLLFPLNQGGYWFITSWLLMMTFSPFLNLILKEYSPKIIKNYLIYGAILWVFLPIFHLNLGYSSLLYFMYLYLLGGSLRLQYITLPTKYSRIVFTTIFSSFICFLISFFFFAGDKINLWILWKFIDVNSPYTLTVSLWIFHLFRNLKIKFCHINWIATSMFGVYLLHNHDLVRPYLWHTLLRMDLSMNSFLFGIWALLVSICVFCLCVILDKILSLIYLPLIKRIETELSKIGFLKKYF